MYFIDLFNIIISIVVGNALLSDIYVMVRRIILIHRWVIPPGGE